MRTKLTLAGAFAFASVPFPEAARGLEKTPVAWRFYTRSLGRCAARFSRNSRAMIPETLKITLHKGLQSAPRAALRLTLLHETAHALAFRDHGLRVTGWNAHGAEWRAACEALGAPEITVTGCGESAELNAEVTHACREVFPYAWYCGGPCKQSGKLARRPRWADTGAHCRCGGTLHAKRIR
jgi:predicted SprT family Zn-dependent metalloprotease